MILRRVSRSGHSLVIAIPTTMVRRFWLQPGDYLKLEDVVEGILIRPLEPRGVLESKLGADGGKGKKKK